MRVVDPIEHAVGATAGAVLVLEGRTQLLADAMRVVQQRADYELIGGEGHPFGELLSELAASGGCNDSLYG